MEKIDFGQLKGRMKQLAAQRRVRIGGAVVLVVIALSIFGIIPWNRLYLTGDPNMIDGRNAYDIALLRAREWQPDVLMDRINSGDIGDTDKSKAWKVVFVSKDVIGKGFVVEVVDREVTSAMEIPYVGTGADYPVETISQEEAIRRFRQTPWNEQVPILSVEAVYGPAGQVWYWGIKTAKGIVSVQAK
ncbi:hypothetical protein A2524_01365 [Candidatus Wolfebacteria bacterium RIFOXYD12_FULL_48_21]|uniref:Uncharacterized protein n=1 Tax=Candidatus Wolfebacteria bacterium RIFOXYD1_FULL_48_65 TaxID=1802561 RepID=A0A1F8DYS6_9BACT|nr:MAG: hypothetical protein A2610_00550 [Candidatus Wolfebacteria bacterium RIFOXYD1_FULL_48_65]OGM94457.1 MAG: hypothetical protein A2524_01365 [Candidatus Wolfebacteria bacterium RIFOXYD12_FULL_48_21]OGM97170.1 MAG: hypothetical protein A2532_02025 [Candidatus Wolfebacteria bacterium RIFOXYD2_FULL_48_11]